MPMCPLLRKECIGEQCAWWHEYEPEEDGTEEYRQCVIAILPKLFNDVYNLLEGGFPVSPDNW